MIIEVEAPESVITNSSDLPCHGYNSIPGDCYNLCKWMIEFDNGTFFFVCDDHRKEWDIFAPQYDNLRNYKVYPS